MNYRSQYTVSFAPPLEPPPFPSPKFCNVIRKNLRRKSIEPSFLFQFNPVRMGRIPVETIILNLFQFHSVEN